ncbi:hypothetical protein POM88_051404 [Heracleum sosnowskyi]|uniref:Uncharacterized protein n=1 Tax=Heracleum sosnowskyi TaxID=360622 RepID=A0AAD8H0K3_9APIA|nr:hypothetical protein POM88_051404 [Heracleum sosnowskyi]
MYRKRRLADLDVFAVASSIVKDGHSKVMLICIEKLGAQTECMYARSLDIYFCISVRRRKIQEHLTDDQSKIIYGYVGMFVTWLKLCRIIEWWVMTDFELLQVTEKQLGRS